MLANDAQDRPRQRAPSKRSLATRQRILDAAEEAFARTGYDGATMRDIAAGSGQQVGLVHHHGGSKEQLFYQVVARRSQSLSKARLAALSAAKAGPSCDLAAILRAFFEPFILLSQSDRRWMSYARLVAHVSSDLRWKEIAAECFDPTAQVFLDEIAALFPDTPRPVIATGFVFSVSALLALLTSQWRIDALGHETQNQANTVENLVSYCTAGLIANVATAE